MYMNRERTKHILIIVSILGMRGFCFGSRGRGNSVGLPVKPFCIV